MGPWYESLCENNPEVFVLDGALLETMKSANAEMLKELDEAIVEAEKDGGGELNLYYYCVYWVTWLIVIYSVYCVAVLCTSNDR